MEFANDELLFLLDALKRREVGLAIEKKAYSDSYQTAVKLQKRIGEYLLSIAMVENLERPRTVLCDNENRVV